MYIRYPTPRTMTVIHLHHVWIFLHSISPTVLYHVWIFIHNLFLLIAHIWMQSRGPHLGWALVALLINNRHIVSTFHDWSRSRTHFVSANNLIYNWFITGNEQLDYYATVPHKCQSHHYPDAKPSLFRSPFGSLPIFLSQGSLLLAK